MVIVALAEGLFAPLMLLAIALSGMLVSAIEALLSEAAKQTILATSPDALWWAVATITTVGYGDMVPVTTVGRAIVFVLMLGGIAFFSGVTANLASFLVKGSSEVDKKILVQLTEQVEGLRQEIPRLQESKSQ